MNEYRKKKALRFLPIGAILLLILVASVPMLSLAQGDLLPLPSTDTEREGTPTKLWAVQLSSHVDADAVAARFGFINHGVIGNLGDYYLFEAADGSTANNPALTNSLRSTPGILFAEQQIAYAYSHRNPTDPQFANQWHLKNTGQSGGTSGNDVNVEGAWNLGFTGAGVVIGVVDDGPEYTHPDLAPNYLASASYDYYAQDSNAAPDYYWEEHGTSVAGVSSAARNSSPHNASHCGVGAAYDSKFAALRLIVGNFSDAQAAGALGHQTNVIDIYNNSWGPYDNGSDWNTAGPLVRQAIIEGVNSGRDGKGVLYVWAGGNGYNGGDHPGADGYVNMRQTFAIAATSDSGVQSWYSEMGPQILVNTSSNDESGITTTDRTGSNGYNGIAGAPDCTNDFGGTSSASPLAAGVFALILEANPELTWRDVQAIAIETATKNDPTNSDWIVNGGGHDYNDRYGFGRLNATAAVALAQTWTNLTAEVSTTSGVVSVNQAIPDNNAAGVTASYNVTSNFVVESVELIPTITHQRRGNLIIEVISPDGTVSRILNRRNADNSGAGISNYPMLSMKHFGEESAGEWKVRVIDNTATGTGTFVSFTLNLYGHAIDEELTPTPSSTEPTPTATEPTATATEPTATATEPTATATEPTATATEPTATATEPTATATEPTATATEPTATSTPVAGLELLQNTGFEATNEAGKPDVEPWKVKNSTGDKIKCNKPEKDKFFAYEGDCAFRFKGGAGENSKIVQKLSESELMVVVSGDTLVLSTWVDSNISAAPKLLAAKGKYSDGEKFKLIISLDEATDGYEYVGLSGTVEGTLVKLKVVYKFTATSGKVYVDNASLKLIIPEGESLADRLQQIDLIDLPAAND